MNQQHLQQRILEQGQLIQDQQGEIRDLQRLIWLAAEQSPGGNLRLDESRLDPLWEWIPHRDEAARIVTIFAHKMPEPTEEQVTQLAMRLSGTNNHPKDAMTALGLGDYPISYLSRRLHPYVVAHQERWMPRSEYDALPEDPKQSPRQ